MPKTVFESPNGLRTYPKYCSELETRIPTQEISLQIKHSSVHDAHSHKMLNTKFKDFEAGLLRAKSREPEAEIHSIDLEAFSESINENRFQEDYANRRPKHDNYKTQDNGKGSKRKAWEMERKAAAVGIQSRKKVEQDSRIVRVSQLTGGKDRHSKVLTAKGLRDRRVRLSIRTAIQLYDLQDRLGLEQPSKAVDWLIQAGKSALDELTVLDTEMASASAGNVAQLTSSECSNVEHCVGSPRESATATAASALSAFRVGQGTNSHKATDGKVISITTMKESDLGRSSSSTSDGSIKGSAEHTSNISLSKSVSRMEARLKARLKARERARKNSSSTKNSVGSPPRINQLKSMQPSLTSPFKNGLPYNTLALESQCSKVDNPCGIHPQVLTGTGIVQQLLDYNSTPSYTDMLYTHDSLSLQNMAPSLTLALQKSFPPVPNTLASMQAVIGSSLQQSYEMTDSAFPFFPPKQSRHLGSNAAQDQGNHLFSNNPIMTLKSVEQQQQQQAQTHINYFASTIVPPFFNDINFSTSSLSSREPLQSNSSFTPNMPSYSHNHKNAYDEASAKSGYDFVPLEDYNVRAFQESYSVQDNANHEHKRPWAKEKQHR